MKEKKARGEDALHATRAAAEEGIVPGGGVALIRAQKAVEALKLENDDQQAGARILLRAMEEPLRQIVRNGGGEPAVVLAKVKDGQGAFGFNAANETYGDMFEMGIIDPTKVTRMALQNAVSVSGLLLTAECAISEVPEEKKKSSMPAGAPEDMDDF